jgi:hypothetical protein
VNPRRVDQRDSRSASAGYSGTPLPQKLGLKSGMRVLALDAPANLDALLHGAPKDLVRIGRIATFDFALAFATSERALAAKFARLAPKMVDDGMIWIGWPKKGAAVTTDLSEDVVRRCGLDAGLVDVKVCAIDTTWSGLKFVRRVRDRRR